MRVIWDFKNIEEVAAPVRENNPGRLDKTTSLSYQIERYRHVKGRESRIQESVVPGQPEIALRPQE